MTPLIIIPGLFEQVVKNLCTVFAMKMIWRSCGTPTAAPNRFHGRNDFMVLMCTQMYHAGLSFSCCQKD